MSHNYVGDSRLRDYLHSFSCCWLPIPNLRNLAKFRENSSLQQFNVIQIHRSCCQL